MSDLNWKNESDYAYTAKLNDAGWAWEFIRRSESYRAAYQALKPEDFKREPSEAMPAHFLSQAEAKEAVNYPLRMPLTLSQRKAAIWWLSDMHNPATIYDPDIIHFKTDNKIYPVMYGPLLEAIGRVSPHPVSDVSDIDSFQMGPTNLAVFVDFGRDISSQIKAIKDVMAAYSSVFPDAVYGKKKQSVELWTRYIRVLDAREDKMPEAQKIEIIHPDKEWREKKTGFKSKGGDSSEWADYASSTLKAAEEMAEIKYRFLLKTV